MRLLFTALACLISVSVFGQGWEQTYGNDDFYARGHSTKQTLDGGFIITGYYDNQSNTNVALIKTDENGIEQWSQTFGETIGDAGYSVQQTSDGGFIITGVLSGSLCLIKTDENGNEEWIQTYSGDRGYSVQQTTDGGYIIAGIIASEAIGVAYDMYLLKTNQNGVAEWSQTYGGDGTTWGSSVQQTTDGGYIIAGAGSILSGYQGYLIKTDSNGIEQWSEFYYGEINEIVDDANIHLYNVQQTFDGGYIIAGNTLQQEEIMTGTYPNDAIIIKTDENGLEEWRKTYGGIYADGFNAIKQTTDGGYISVGVTYSMDYVFLLYLLKTDENGNEEWIQTYEGLQAAFGTDISLTFDGGYIITGFTASDTTNSKVYLIKTDSEGTLSSEFTITTPTPRKLDKVVDALGREVNHTTNQILFHIYDDGSVEKKFIVE